MLSYAFMQRAFLVGLVFAVILPALGLIMVLKRLSMVGDALSHISLAGVAAGLLMGINPIAGAVIVSIFAGLSIEWLRRRIAGYEELSIALIMSFGVGLAGVLSGFVPSAGSFHQYLFGSIVSITTGETVFILVLSVAVMLLYFYFYPELMIYAFDEERAKLMHVRRDVLSFVFTILTAVTVAVASKIIGALLVSSMMVIPVTCALRLSSSFKKTLLVAIAFAAAFVVTGLTLSYYYALRPGGTIVLVGILAVVLVFSLKRK